jgi:hypothetical protein
MQRRPAKHAAYAAIAAPHRPFKVEVAGNFTTFQVFSVCLYDHPVPLNSLTLMIDRGVVPALFDGTFHAWTKNSKRRVDRHCLPLASWRSRLAPFPAVLPMIIYFVYADHKGPNGLGADSYEPMSL